MGQPKSHSSVPPAILAEVETAKKRAKQAKSGAESALRAGKKALAKAERAVQQTTETVRPERGRKV